MGNKARFSQLIMNEKTSYRQLATGQASRGGTSIARNDAILPNCHAAITTIAAITAIDDITAIDASAKRFI